MALDYKTLLSNLEDKGFVRSIPIFDHHTVKGGGMLPDRFEAHAAWYYCMCAVGMLREVDEEHSQYEGELDHQSMLNNIVRSVSALYNLESPDMLLKHMPDCRLEAIRLDIGWDERMEKPFLDRYVKRDN